MEGLLHRAGEKEAMNPEPNTPPFTYTVRLLAALCFVGAMEMIAMWSGGYLDNAAHNLFITFLATGFVFVGLLLLKEKKP